MKRMFVMLGLVLMVAMPVMAEEHAGCLRSTGMEQQVTNLDNGVKVSMTATDPKLVAEIQAKTAKGCTPDCPMMAKDVTRTVENTANGVLVTATSTDPAVVKAMQEHAAEGCGDHQSAKAGCEHGDAAKAGCKHGETAKTGGAHEKATKHACPMTEGSAAAKS